MVLYEALGRVAPSPVVELNRAVAISMAHGPAAALPIADDSVDLVYSRQVLHHAVDLDRFVAEVARILRPGGTLLACREHVVDDDGQKQAFLAAHPVNRLAGVRSATGWVSRSRA